MSEEIIKVFDYIGDKLGIAIDYTQENIQPYLEDLWHRFITYEIVVHSIWTLISLIGIIICSYLIVKLTYRDSGIFLLVAAISVAAILTSIMICQISDLIELLIIPEKFILQLIKTTMQ